MSAKFAFLFVLVINCLLWSYTRRFQADLQLSSWDITKRSYTERGDESVWAQCAPRTLPDEEQCTHARNVCPGSSTFLSIHYLQSYYCTVPSWRPLRFGGLIIWLAFLFSTLGISASDFFCPNLGTLADLLGLDENVAGVTFLAFGNGSPDVFSTFSAMQTNTASLAIGELLGAASFIVSCVVGSMCVVKPFKVHPYPFLRDVGFFTTAVALLIAVLWDGRLHAWETALLIVLYVIYVVVVVAGTWWTRRREKKRETEALIRGEYDENELPIEEPYHDEVDLTDDANLLASSSLHPRSSSNPDPRRTLARLELPTRPLSHHPSSSRSQSRSHSPSSTLRSRPSYSSRMATFSLVGALEFRHFVASMHPHAAAAQLPGLFESPATPYGSAFYRRHSRSLPRTPLSSSNGRSGPAPDRDPWDTALGLDPGVPLNERPASPQAQVALPVRTETPTLISPVDEEEDEIERVDAAAGAVGSTGFGPAGMIIPEIHQTPPTPRIDAIAFVAPAVPRTKRERVRHALARTSDILFPTLQDLGRKNFASQVASVFAAPAMLALTLTLPVVFTPYDDPAAPREKRMSVHSSAAEDEESRLIDFEEEGLERTLMAEDEVQEELHDHSRFNKWLMAIQCVLGPLFCAAVVLDGMEHEGYLLLATAVAGLATGTLVAVFAHNGERALSRLVRCSMGFIVAVIWIKAIADEVVHVLQTFGFIFGLSNAIIGLTIFAVGNSLADLVANMSVAAFAPIMGFSACFGGPMLNMLLGVGVSGSYIISQTQKPYDLDFSNTLVISSIGLLALLMVTAVVVPLNGYFLSRRWGFFLMFFYAVVMSINVVVELRS